VNRLAAFATFALCLAAAAAGSAEVRQVGALTYDGIPIEHQDPLPGEGRFDNMRSAFFQGWLADGSILIQTRFGNVDQVHRVDGPQLARTQLTFGADPVNESVAQPGSDRFVFERDAGGDEAYQGYFGRSEGDAVRITDPGTRNEAFVFSPDGSLLAWSRMVPGKADAAVMIMSPGAPESRRMAFQGKGTVAPVDISGDGEFLLVEQRESIVRNQYLLVDTRSGKATHLLPERPEAAFRNGRFLPDGRRVALTLIGDDGIRSFAVLDIAEGKLRFPAGRAEWDVELFDLAPDGHRVALSTNQDGFSRVSIVDLDRPEMRRSVPVPDGMIFKLRFSPDGRRLGIGLSTATGGDVWSWDGGDKVVRWTRSELGGIDEASLSLPSLVRFRSFDGRTIPAFVYRPRKAAAGRSPVIISVHGGPEAQERTWFNPQYQYWTGSLGAVVIAPNVRGSTGYGSAYLSLDDGAKREDAVKDIGALLDWIAAQPDLDAGRVVVYGESYGGFMSLASLAAYSDRLAGAIDVVGISNFTTFLQNTEGYRRDRRRAEYGDERDPAMRAFFDRISPLARADRMRKPLLVVAGGNDIRVPVSESRAIVERVRADGGTAWLLVAADEGHGFQKRSNLVAQSRVQTQFLRRVFGQASTAGAE
jgi:dipeptidyl aminopeptidase/acylaminoacyl peptidase